MENKVEVKEKVKVEKKVLWCPKCQCGLGNGPESQMHSAGETCPMCLKLKRNENDLGILEDAKTYSENYIKRAEMIRAERDRNKPKHIKSIDEHRKEIEAEHKATVDEMQKQIDALSKLIQNKTESTKKVSGQPK